MWEFRYGPYGMKGELIQTFVSKELAKQYINSFVKDVLHFTSYYTKYNIMSEDEIIVDYGSHINFITIKRKEWLK